MQLLEADVAIPDSSCGGAVEAVHDIRCQAVSYRYPDTAEPTIVGLTCHFKRGECAVLSGPSGSGKSTILKLLLRLLEPTQGQISANGVAYEDIDANSLRSNFAVLMQHGHLFSGTVRQVVTELRPPGKRRGSSFGSHGCSLDRAASLLATGIGYAD